MARPRSDFSRMKVPADAVRTREQILADAHYAHGAVWETCGNCGGRGTYPSSCTPPGMCRFYCWAVAIPGTIDLSTGGPQMVSKMGTKYADTFGKRPVSVDKYVKRCQAADRSAWRTATWLEATKDERAAEQAQAEAARLERETEKRYWEEAKAAAIAARHCLGSEGEKITVDVRVEGIHEFESRYGAGRIVRMRDGESNQVVWFTSSYPAKLVDAQNAGALVRITGTVKQCGSYQGEAQTVVTRVKVEQPAQAQVA